MFMAAASSRARKGKPPKGPSTDNKCKEHVRPHSGISLSHRRNRVLTHSAAWMSLENMLRERRQTHKATRGRVPSLNVQNGQIHSRLEGAQGWGGQGWAAMAKGTRVLSRLTKCLQTGCGVGCTALSILKPAELYSRSRSFAAHELNLSHSRWQPTPPPPRSTPSDPQSGGASRTHSPHTLPPQLSALPGSFEAFS